MKRFIWLLLLGIIFFTPQRVFAQQKATIKTERVGDLIKDLAESSTPSAEVATASAEETIKKIEKKPDITEPQPETLGKLEKILRDNPIGALNPTNFLQHAIREAIKRGVPANTFVLLLLFPIVVALVAFARHVLGLEGFGIFTPAILSVAFLAVGITSGIILFFGILAGATFSRMLMRKVKLQFLPRMALILWSVSLVTVFMIFVASFLKLEQIMTVSIFPILILILLAENFIEVQSKSMRTAVGMTLVTLLMALFSFAILNWGFLQAFAILHPEVVVFGVLVFDLVIGRYTGFRLLEYQRFKAAERR